MTASLKDALKEVGIESNLQSQGKIVDRRAEAERLDKEDKQKAAEEQKAQEDAESQFFEYLRHSDDEFDILTWESYGKFIKPHYKSIGTEYKIFRFDGLGIAIRREELAEVISKALKGRFKNATASFTKASNENVYRLKPTKRDREFISAFVKGRKMVRRMSDGKLRMKDDAVISFESRLRVVEIEYLWEVMKTSQTQDMATMRALAAEAVLKRASK